MDSETLRFRILEADVRAQQKRADEYHELLLSLVEESASTSLSTVPQPQPISPAPAPARPANSIRSSSRRQEIAAGVPAVVTGALAQLRPARSTSVALTNRPAPYQPASGRNKQPWSSSSQASTTPIGGTHQDDSEVASDVPDDADAIQEILDSTGLVPYSLSWGEHERANMTPSIRRSSISKAFGGDARREWFECNRRPNYKHFLCADGARAQPFAPTRVGDRGLMLFSPAWFDAASDEEGQIFHAFVSTNHRAQRDTEMNYVGDYTKVPLLQTHMEWSLLPLKCQRAWLNRLFSSRTPMGHTLYTRIKLRELLKREPSVAEVQGRMQDAPVIEIQWQKLSAAFKSGKEKLQVVGIKCEGYNAHLASIILMEDKNM
ncbi:hypothetical protein EDB92DRAFT_1857358 [Lactarius akahatsu]|uniref:DUF6697 domain-containing protein n=1 Tax=Lactarius akahatsu TaxID=416441 RepID=A0AAD4QB54_9AGAM|nr:hypothetical protein EDB92DRAFT_1857358 [Lactarius akahatsu]